MYMDAGLDTGDALLERRLHLRRRETAGTLHDRMAAAAPAALFEALDLLAAGLAPRQPQGLRAGHVRPKAGTVLRGGLIGPATTRRLIRFRSRFASLAGRVHHAAGTTSLDLENPFRPAGPTLRWGAGRGWCVPGGQGLLVAAGSGGLPSDARCRWRANGVFRRRSSCADIHSHRVRGWGVCRVAAPK